MHRLWLINQFANTPICLVIRGSTRWLQVWFVVVGVFLFLPPTLTSLNVVIADFVSQLFVLLNDCRAFVGCGFSDLIPTEQLEAAA